MSSCAICLDTLPGRFVPPHNDEKGKKHLVHEDCLDEWYTKSNQCPVCTKIVFPHKSISSEVSRWFGIAAVGTAAIVGWRVATGGQWAIGEFETNICMIVYEVAFAVLFRYHPSN